MGVADWFRMKEEDRPRFYELVAWAAIMILELAVSYKDKTLIDLADAGAWDPVLVAFGGTLFIFLFQDSLRASFKYDSFNVDCEEGHDTTFSETPSSIISEQYYMKEVKVPSKDSSGNEIETVAYVKVVVMEETGIWFHGGNSILAIGLMPPRVIRGWSIDVATTKFVKFAHGTNHICADRITRHPWDRDKINPLVLDRIRQLWPSFDDSDAIVYEYRSASEKYIVNEAKDAAPASVSDLKIDYAFREFNRAEALGVVSVESLKRVLKESLGGNVNG